MRAAEAQLHVQFGGDPCVTRPHATGQVPRINPYDGNRGGHFHGLAREGGVLVESGE